MKKSILERAREVFDIEMNGVAAVRNNTDSIEQAVERAGTKAGNKGFDAMTSAIEMVDLTRQL